MTEARENGLQSQKLVTVSCSGASVYVNKQQGFLSLEGIISELEQNRLYAHWTFLSNWNSESNNTKLK